MISRAEKDVFLTVIKKEALSPTPTPITNLNIHPFFHLRITQSMPSYLFEYILE